MNIILKILVVRGNQMNFMDINTHFTPKEGMLVLLHDEGTIIEAYIASLDFSGRDGDYKISLKDKKSGLLLKSGDKPRIWMLNRAIKVGTICLPNYDQFCPVCQKNYLFQGQKLCQNCIDIREEKKNFFAQKVKINAQSFVLNNDQIEPLLSNRNLLVVARAGSGKTRVLVAKLIDLFYSEGLKEDEVLAFCFNRDAADEIRKRLNSDCKVEGYESKCAFNVVSTFHAFAKDIIGNDKGQILVDDARTKFIKKIISDLRNQKPDFEKNIREFFLSDILKIDRKKFDSIEQYYRFIRNSRYRTLKGDYVKSIPEKIIADFLFERNIQYTYERHFYLNKVDLNEYNKNQITNSEFEEYKKLQGGRGETVPDFYLSDYGIVWEHWGITGNESELEKSEFSKEICDYDEYSRKKEWKRAFWNKWRYGLIAPKRSNDFQSVKRLLETDPSDFYNRNEIEAKLERLLQVNGIKCEKLSEKEIIRRVWENSKDYFTTQIIGFIDKFQQSFSDNEEEFVQQAKNVKDNREKAFLRVGWWVYKEYKIRLEKNPIYKYDFNQSLSKATLKINHGECDERIKQLKWILIDEFQDFSDLFYKLIDAIRSRNPDIKFFCVGDDWQAINRYAGSDLKYFEEFETFFSNSALYNITTNFRSEKQIVSNAMDFIQRFNMPGKSQIGINSNTGTIKESPIDCFDPSLDKYEWLLSEGGPWENCYQSAKREIQAYIKTISEIINKNFDKKIMILNRKNNFLSKDLNEIKEILLNKKLFRGDPKAPNFDVKTVHRSKGEESDLVILTEINENSFPIFHPDNNLFGVFGENETTIMEDEIRLYYVALTRAKSSVYIFYSKDIPSCFIKESYSPTKNMTWFLKNV